MSSISFLSEEARRVLAEDFSSCDSKFDEIMSVLRKKRAAQCFHKHGTFLEHLFDVWRILYLWKQSTEVCRTGFVHSDYSNSYVNLAVFKIDDGGRQEVTRVCGAETEALTYLFCRVNRHELIWGTLLVSPDLEIPDAISMENIETKEPIELDRLRIAQMVVLTMADLADQNHDWQDRLFRNDNARFMFEDPSNFASLFPGSGKPGLWVSCCARLGKLLKSAHVADPRVREAIPDLPPVFESCTKLLDEKDEIEARDLYWRVVTELTESQHHQDAAECLDKAIELNPFVGEPHALRAHLCVLAQDWDGGVRHAEAAVALLCDWGCPWDKRLSLGGWVSWSRVLLGASTRREWVKDSWGMLNLGMVDE